MRRVVGRLNTVTSDGRMIKSLYDPDSPIPVRIGTDVVGLATWELEGDNIVAEINLRYVGEGEDLTPHIEILVPESHQEGDTWVVDVGILKAIFLDDQPDAFGDLNT